MDPVTGDDQVIEGAFAYFNGKVVFFFRLLNVLMNN